MTTPDQYKDPELRRALVLSPVPIWPIRNGYSMAVHSDIAALSALGYQITVLAFSPSGTSPCDVTGMPLVSARTLPCSRGGRFRRFVRSMMRQTPAVWERWYNDKAAAIIKSTVSEMYFDVLLIEDVPLAGYALSFAKQGLRPILRLHNAQVDTLRGLSRNGDLVGKLMSLVEARRILNFERIAVTALPRVWCISRRDAEIIKASYSCTHHEVLGVSMHRPDLLSIAVEEGSCTTLLHIGGVDIKKRPGVERLLEGFRRLRASANTDMKLVMAGSQTVRIGGLPAAGVTSLGAVEDDVSVFRQGRFFINPQNVSGGIKLKSICALLAGRTLISTDEGVEGLDLTPNVHFVRLEDPVDLAVVMRPLIDDEVLALRIAGQGRQAALEQFDRQTTVRELQELLAKRKTDDFKLYESVGR